MKQYVCDRCRDTVEDADESRIEWSAIGIAKVTTPSVPFQKADLCPTCTTILRRFLSGAEPDMGPGFAPEHATAAEYTAFEEDEEIPF